MRWTVLFIFTIVVLSSHAFARDCDRWGYCRNPEMYRARDTYIPPPVYSGINCWAGAQRLLWVRSRSCLQPISLQNHSVSVRVLWHLQSQTQGVVDGHLSTNVLPPVKAGPAKCCTTWIDGGGGPGLAVEPFQDIGAIFRPQVRDL